MTKLLVNSFFFAMILILISITYSKDTYINLLSSPDQVAQIGFISVSLNL